MLYGVPFPRLQQIKKTQSSLGSVLEAENNCSLESLVKADRPPLAMHEDLTWMDGWRAQNNIRCGSDKEHSGIWPPLEKLFLPGSVLFPVAPLSSLKMGVEKLWLFYRLFLIAPESLGRRQWLHFGPTPR